MNWLIIFEEIIFMNERPGVSIDIAAILELICLPVIWINTMVF